MRRLTRTLAPRLPDTTKGQFGTVCDAITVPNCPLGTF